MMKKGLRIRLLISTEYTNATDRRTDTARRHRPRLCIVSHGRKQYDKNTNIKTCKRQTDRQEKSNGQ